MFTVPAAVTFLASAGVTAFYGWEAFRGWAAKIDTKAEAMDFAEALLLTGVGLSGVVTSLHVLVS